MKGLYDLSQERGQELARRLQGASDVKAAQDEAARYLDELGAQYASEAVEPDRRRRALGLLAVAKAALEAMGAVSQAEILRLPGPAPRADRRDLRGKLCFLPALLAAAAAVWTLVGGQLGLCLLCALSAMGSFWTAERGRREVPQQDLQARPQADAAQLARRVDYLLREIDAQLRQEPDAPLPAPRLTTPMLESVQMLLEAQLTGDAQYALKGVSPLAAALARQGVDFVTYAPERAQDFDLLPAPVGGETIRPAVRQGDLLLLRGQATVKK